MANLCSKFFQGLFQQAPGAYFQNRKPRKEAFLRTLNPPVTSATLPACFIQWYYSYALFFLFVIVG